MIRATAYEALCDICGKHAEYKAKFDEYGRQHQPMTHLGAGGTGHWCVAIAFPMNVTWREAPLEHICPGCHAAIDKFVEKMHKASRK